MQMVASARRFGPGAMTVVLILVAALASGILYASQNWSEVSRQLEATKVTNGATLDRQSATTRKSEKPKSNENVGGISSVRNREQSETKVDNFKKLQPLEKPSTSRDGSTSTPANSEVPLHQPQKRNRPSAPSIRLPKPEVADNMRLTSYDTGVRKYGSSPAPPRFFRSADGTLTVQFPDGSTRIVKPGERSGQ
jgi:hypothetical protein